MLKIKIIYFLVAMFLYDFNGRGKYGEIFPFWIIRVAKYGDPNCGINAD